MTFGSVNVGGGKITDYEVIETGMVGNNILYETLIGTVNGEQFLVVPNSSYSTWSLRKINPITSATIFEVVVTTGGSSNSIYDIFSCDGRLFLAGVFSGVPSVREYNEDNGSLISTLLMGGQNVYNAKENNFVMKDRYYFTVTTQGKMYVSDLVDNVFTPNITTTLTSNDYPFVVGVRDNIVYLRALAGDTKRLFKFSYNEVNKTMSLMSEKVYTDAIVGGIVNNDGRYVLMTSIVYNSNYYKLQRYDAEDNFLDERLCATNLKFYNRDSMKIVIDSQYYYNNSGATPALFISPIEFNISMNSQKAYGTSKDANEFLNYSMIYGAKEISVCKIGKDLIIYITRRVTHSNTNTRLIRTHLKRR